MKRVVLLLLVFVIKCQSLFAQQWVWDEMSKEEREPISFGGIALFAIVVFIGYLIVKLVSSNKKDGHNNNNNTYSSTQNQTNSGVVTHSKTNSATSSPEIIKSEPLTPIELEGFTLSPDGKRLIKGSDIEECHIPYGIKVICRNAFKDALKVKRLFIPETVEEVEDFAFSSMEIESVHIPKSINKWGESAFFMCSKLKRVYFEDELKTLGTQMFMCCEKLESIVLPESIKYIPEDMFYGCETLKTIKFPSNLMGIGDSAFYCCESIERIELPSTIIGLRDDTFSDCYSLSEVTIPEGVTVISSRCFARCGQIKKIRIPSTMLHIDNNAFVDCYDISLEVPIGTAATYKEMNLDGVAEIVEYDTNMSNNINELKASSENFIKIQNYKRERDDYEFRKEMGLLTKEEYERENAWYLDVMNEQDVWDDI